VEVVVTGIGLVSPWGGSLEASWQKTDIWQIWDWAASTFSELRTRPLALVDKQPSELTKRTQVVVAAALKTLG